MPGLSREAQILRERLQRKYMDSLPAKRSRIEEDWQRVQSSGWSESALAALRTNVHRLVGSAGSYGLHSLSDAAAKLESSLRSADTLPEWRKRVGRQVERLKQKLATSSSDL